jgi:formate dehydrogenase major subunit
MEPTPESILREINRGGWSTGYTGQSPERLKAHMANQAKFDLVTLRAPADDPEVGGDYYGLPWPCWGTPEIRYPGTHTLYNPNLPVKDGGAAFRPRFGLDRDGQTLLAEGSYPPESDIQDGYPQFTMGVLKHLGWDSDLTAEERAVIESIGGGDEEAIDAVSWSIDLSGGIQRVAIEHGCVPYGNGKARAVAWNLPDPIPVHREPIYSPRPDLVADYPTLENGRQFRMPNIGHSLQQAAVDNKLAESFPIVLTSGRLVEYEGGGEETRSNKWLAELQQDMFVEINPQDAEARGIAEGQHGLGDRSRRRLEGARQGAGHRARGARRRLHALPLLGPLRGRGPQVEVPAGHRPDRARRNGQPDHQLRLRSRDGHA